MDKITNEEKELLKEKISNINLDIYNIPEIFKLKRKIIYRPLRGYENNYKIYQYIDIKNIEIYITPTTRLESTDKKYKLAEPLMNYLQEDREELLEKHITFLKLLNELDMEKLKLIEKEQKAFQEKTPYEIKFRDNFIWEIYYSEVDDKYFMMFPSMEEQVESLFYLIKKQIELQDTDRTEMIYVPVNNMEYESGILKKSEISDLENYLWYFTSNWPTVYEVKDKDSKYTLQVLGKVTVFDKINSTYKFVFNSKEEAQNEFKLIKALFILASNVEDEYKFETEIDNKGKLSFYFNSTTITYENLSNFIKEEILNNTKKIAELENKNKENEEKLAKLKEEIVKQNIEYVEKEKQIASFLECKKTFFGKIGYFFKGKKKKKEEIKNEESIVKEDIVQENIENIKIEEKEFYTIEDLLKLCNIYEEKEKEYKDNEMDLKALENKHENLERKIKNAVLYIEEIESHKKSIFDFWKFTNKDNVPLLIQGEEKEEKDSKEKIRKVFSFEEDIEQVGKKIDLRQRTLFSEKETDAIFAIYQDLQSFKNCRKEELTKQDEKIVEENLNKLKDEYKKEYEKIKEKDFDIFGSVVEDKTKIKVLNNQKHREIEKEKYKVLDINLNTTIDEYKDNIKHYLQILEGAYVKMTSPYDIKVYMASNKEIEYDNYEIMHMEAEKAIEYYNNEEDDIVLNCVYIKEDMPTIFYSNIMFFGNSNMTLPEGMNITEEVLLDLKQYKLNKINEKEFNVNFISNEFKNEIKNIKVCEYEIEREK